MELVNKGTRSGRNARSRLSSSKGHRQSRELKQTEARSLGRLGDYRACQTEVGPSVYETIGPASDVDTADNSAQLDDSRNASDDDQEASGLLDSNSDAYRADSDERQSPLYAIPQQTTGRRYQNALDAERAEDTCVHLKHSNCDLRVSTYCTNPEHGPASHYQMPDKSNSCIEQEMNQMIETQRKRTLFMLRQKEAPKASFEISSPAGMSSLDSANGVDDECFKSAQESPVEQADELLSSSACDLSTHQDE